MGYTFTQLLNCQRSIIFMLLFSITSVITFLTIKLIKKQIDIKQSEHEEAATDSAADKYKENQVTVQQFETKVLVSTILTEDDTCTERFMKKILQYNVYFCPMLIIIVLSFITGRSRALSVIFYIVSIICCFLFNVFKVHRACIEQKIFRFLIQIIWVVFNFLVLLDILLSNPTNMMYNIVQA